ncbi:MAG: hypothetical protein H6741_31845 [Alphaproteobacteria bacterium]|nr:hypothetical protein [Alphaproteobacteria bacterium]
MTLNARIAALSPAARQRLIQEMQAPGHLLSPPNAPGAVHALELIAWAEGPGRVDELAARVAALEPPDER